MKRNLSQGFLYVAFLACLAAPVKSAPKQVEVPAEPVYSGMKDWLEAIQQLKPDLKLLASGEVNPGILVAIFRAGNDCLTVCTYDVAAHSNVADVSYAVRDDRGHELVDIERAKQCPGDDLCENFKVTKLNGDYDVYTVCYGEYYPILNHYSGKAKVLVIAQDGKTHEFPITMAWPK